jgi:hypothetical protein
VLEIIKGTRCVVRAGGGVIGAGGGVIGAGGEVIVLGHDGTPGANLGTTLSACFQ